MGREVKNDKSSQFEHTLRVCKVKLRKCLPFFLKNGEIR